MAHNQPQHSRHQQDLVIYSDARWKHCDGNPHQKREGAGELSRVSVGPSAAKDEDCGECDQHDSDNSADRRPKNILRQGRLIILTVLE